MSTTIEFKMAWPPKQLSPNKRLHWALKARWTKSYRNECFYDFKAQQAQHMALLDKIKALGKIPIMIEFHPPDNIRRDKDNMIASFKAGQDGFADALGVDDSKFMQTYDLCPAIKGGQIILKFSV